MTEPGLNANQEMALREALGNGGAVAPGTTRAALIRRGLVYPMDHPGFAGRLTYEGERVAKELSSRAAGTPDPVAEKEPAVVVVKPGELVYVATSAPNTWHYFPQPETLSDPEVTPLAEVTEVREALVAALGFVEGLLDERGYFTVPKRYLPAIDVRTENGA